MTEVYLIRHAEAEGNAFRRLHGQYDSLLTPRGRRQVECLRRRFENISIDGCFSSDLTRTSLTARSVYLPKNLPLHRDPRLREMHMGQWEDLPFGWLERLDADLMKQLTQDPVHCRIPGGEAFDDYVQRVYEGMVDAASRYDGGTIAVFAHGCVIRGLLIRLFFGGDSAKSSYSENTTVCKLLWNKGVLTYEYLNDSSHLPEELSTYAAQRWWRESNHRRDVNCYFVPYSDQICLPAGLTMPDRDSGGTCFVTMLHDEAVGVVSLGRPEGKMGRIMGMALKDGMEGRMYGDQMLGQAISHFRKLGCTHLAANAGAYPDDLLNRYEFSGEELMRSIDTNCFDWRDSHAKN